MIEMRQLSIQYQMKILKTSSLHAQSMNVCNPQSLKPMRLSRSINIIT